MIEAKDTDNDLWATLDPFGFGEESVVRKSRPVWPEAATTMNIDVAVNSDSSVWVIHDKHFPDYIEWVEFDMESRVMTFVTAGGKIQNLGLTIHPPMDGYVARAKQVALVLFKDKEIRDFGIVPIAVRRK
jgi:hypothetical protein